MSAGDRKVKILDLVINRANPVMALAAWGLFIENKVGVDIRADGGSVRWSLGTPAVARAKSLQTIENEAIAQVEADTNTPANDGVA